MCTSVEQKTCSVSFNRNISFREQVFENNEDKNFTTSLLDVL